MSEEAPEYEPKGDGEEEQDELDEVTEASARLSEVASQLEALAAVDVTDVLVRDVVRDTRLAHLNVAERIIVNKPNQRLTDLSQRRDSALGQLNDSQVADAHVRFMEAIGVEVSGADAQAKQKTAESLVAQLAYAAKGEVIPDNGAAGLDGNFAAVSDSWSKLGDKHFWTRLVGYYEGCPVTVGGLTEHLVLMGIAIESAPKLVADFSWRSNDARSAAVNKLVASAGATAKGAGIGGTIDMAAMYRMAENLTHFGQPVPRSMAAELVRFATTALLGGVADSTASPPTAKLTVARLLQPEPIPADPTLADAATQRNKVRVQALKVVEAPKTDSSGVHQSQTDLLSDRYATAARAGRRALSEVLTSETSVVADAIRRKGGSAQAVADSLEGIPASSGLVPALEAWSNLYSSATRDPRALSSALKVVERAATVYRDSILRFDALNPVQQLAYETLRQVEAVTAEVARQTAELLSPDPVNSGSRLGGALAAIDTAGVQGRWRESARLARESATGLSDFITRSLPNDLGSGWCQLIQKSSATWSLADDADLSALLKQTPKFAADLRTARAQALTLDWAERFRATSAIDALALVVAERLQGLTTTSDPDPLLTQIPDLVKDLLSVMTKRLAPTEVSRYMRDGWKSAKTKPKGGILEARTALQTWEAATSARPADLAQVSAAAYAAAEVIADTRARLEACKKCSPEDQATLLSSLDDIVAVMLARMRAMEPTTPDPRSVAV